jgi:hypothetical protein
MFRRRPQHRRDAPLGSETERAWGAFDLGTAARTRRDVVGCCDTRHRGDRRRRACGLGRAPVALHQGQRCEAWPEVVRRSPSGAGEDRTPRLREIGAALVSSSGKATHQTRRAGITLAARPQPALAGRKRGHPQSARLAVRGERECRGRACVGGAGALGVSQGAADRA